MCKLAVELGWIRTEVDVQEAVWFTGCDFVELHERLQRIDRGDFSQDAQELLLVSHAAYTDELRIHTNHGRERCILLNAADRAETEVPPTNKKSREHILGLIVHDPRIVRKVVEHGQNRKTN